MSFKSKLATITGKAIGWGLRTFTKGGSSLPGKIAQKIDPDVLKELGKNYRVILITGTNGKTLTTALTTNIVKQKYEHVLTNPTGSNMKQGIVSTFINDSKNNLDEKIAILEVDEASLRYITEYIEPELIVITNLFRDQTDRYADVYSTLDLILEGADRVPNTTLLVNGDEPIFSSEKIKNPIKYFGFENSDKETNIIPPKDTEDAICPKCRNQVHYHYITYDNLGDYYCINCGNKRPKLNYILDNVDELTTQSSSFTIEKYSYTIQAAGLYNVYNALTAYSIGRYLGVSQEKIAEGYGNVKKVFGRQESIQVNDKEVIINLMKNPVGLNQIIRLVELEEKPFTLISILNNQPADGKDTAWINDGHFEKLARMDNLDYAYAAGSQAQVMKNRLIEAGIKKAQVDIKTDSQELIDTIHQVSTEKVYVLATYTGMTDLRKEMAEQGLVKERMQA